MVITQEYPLPTRKTTLGIQFQQPSTQQRRNCRATKHPKEKDRNPLRDLLFRIPRRQRKHGTGDIPSFGKTENSPRQEETSSIPHEDLQRGNHAEYQDLATNPPSRANLRWSVLDITMVETGK